MEISFRTKELRKLCEDRRHADETLGVKVADILRRRLADLRAASRIEDVLLGNPSFDIHEGEQRFQLELDGFGALLFKANHLRNAANLGNAIEWTLVSRLKLVEVELADV